MVQTVKTITLPAGQRKIFFEKPHVLRRIFVSIQVLAPPEAWAESRISFDDPSFSSHYVFDGPVQQLEAKGEGIFQGTIWAWNVSPVDILFIMTEILI